MKKILLTIATFISISYSIAQAPEGINYQAVVRDASGNVITNQNVSYQISILQGSTNGSAVYVETHNLATNDFGLTNFQIGNGTTVSGAFNQIDWSADSYFVKIELDENGGSNYTTMGTSQLMSVPYALHAKTAENVPTNISELNNDAGYITNADDADSDPTNEIETWNTLSGIPAGFSDNIDNVDDSDADPTNELQTLSISGNDLSISGGNTVTLPSGSNFSGDYNDLINQPSIPTNTSDLNNDSGFITNADDADSDPTNEIETWNTLSGIPAGFSDNIDNVDDSDADATNELQDLSITDNDLTISSGSTVTLPQMHLSYDNIYINSLANVGGTYQHLGVVGTFTKLKTNTVVEITFTGHLKVGALNNSNFVVFEMRVNDVSSTIIPAEISIKGTQVGQDVWVTFTGYFTNIPSGWNEVDFYVMAPGGSATNVSSNSGNYSGNQLIIKEYFAN